MASGINQTYVNGCKPLDRAQSAATYIQLAIVQNNLEFLQEFVDMADRNVERIENFCLPGMYDLIKRQLDALYKATLILCPEIDKIEAEDIQKEIELKNMRVDLRR